MSSPSSGSSSESAILDSSKSPSGKLCIVSTYSSERFYYAIFIIDLESPLVVVADDDGFIPWAPTILFDLTSMRDARFYAVCVLNSTLYFFEKCRPAVNGLPRRGKSVYTYDLSSHLSTTDEKDKSKSSTTVKVDKTMLCPASEMLWPKHCPVATPTPDGNGILVFSSQLYYNPLDVNLLDIDAIDFELYLPLKKKLPSLQDYLKEIGASPAKFGIGSFAFITNSVFLIQIKFGTFTVDIDMPVPVWKKHSDPICVPFCDVIEGDMLWLTAIGAYDVSNGFGDMFDPSKASRFPNSSSFGTGFKFRDPISSDMHTIYDRQGNVFGIVQLQLGINKHTKYAHMILDVCSFDLDKYRNDKKNVGADARLETNLIKSFKFVMDGYKCYDFYPLCLSPIQEGTK